MAKGEGDRGSEVVFGRRRGRGRDNQIMDIKQMRRCCYGIALVVASQGRGMGVGFEAQPRRVEVWE